MVDKGQLDIGVPQAVEVTGISGAGAVIGGAVDERNGDLIVLLGGDGIGAVGGVDNNRDLLLKTRLVRRHTEFLATQADGLRAVDGISQLVFEISGIVRTDRDDVAAADLDSQAKLEDEMETTGTAVTASAAELTAIVAVLGADASNMQLTLAAPIKDELTSGIGLG